MAEPLTSEQCGCCYPVPVGATICEECGKPVMTNTSTQPKAGVNLDANVNARTSKPTLSQHNQARDRIEACVKEIKAICDEFGYDPYRWLSDFDQWEAYDASAKQDT